MYVCAYSTQTKITELSAEYIIHWLALISECLKCPLPVALHRASPFRSVTSRPSREYKLMHNVNAQYG